VNTIAIGCDPNAQALKEALIAHLREKGYTVVDYGSEDTVYANVAFKVSEAVARGEHSRAILICGTGIGMSVAANKVKGAYAALIGNEHAAERAALSNDVNIVTLGSQTTDPEFAKKLIDIWMSLDYIPGGRSDPKNARIREYDQQRG